MKKTLLLLLSLASFACLNAQSAIEKDIQTRLIMAEDGDVVTLPEGHFHFNGSLSLDEKKRITIRGAGQEKTVLSFKNQQQGAEGLRVSNCSQIVLEHFTIEDSKGDLIKTMNVQNIVFRDVTARWTGKPKASNGSYALYPVQCQTVRIERCTAIGASDAGIYVGQSDSVWVSNCVAHHNVAGIEIENTTNAWVYDNYAHDNTGGLLVFDLPDLPKKRGGHVEVHHNKVEHNNYKNFAPKGNIVGKVPPGTGVMILATNDVRVHHNNVSRNRTASTVIVSYFIAETPIKDKDYNPYPSQIFIYDNLYSGEKSRPSWKSKMGFLFWLKFGRKVPEILYDGIQNQAWLNDDGSLKPEYRICIGNNKNGTFANLKADKNFKGISRDLKPYTCR